MNLKTMETSTKKSYKALEKKALIPIKFYITPLQYEKFASKVQNSNLTISSYIRKKIGLEPK